MKGGEGKRREGNGRGGKRREGKEREKKGREGKGKRGKGRELSIATVLNSLAPVRNEQKTILSLFKVNARRNERTESH